jgi:hypothetical protein
VDVEERLPDEVKVLLPIGVVVHMLVLPFHLYVIDFPFELFHLIITEETF